MSALSLIMQTTTAQIRNLHDMALDNNNAEIVALCTRALDGCSASLRICGLIVADLATYDEDKLMEYGFTNIYG
jgi:hypothetical protein